VRRSSATLAQKPPENLPPTSGTRLAFNQDRNEGSAGGRVVTTMTDREHIRQRFVQSFKASLIDGSLLIVLAAILVLIAYSTHGS
jgi:hypothetical protein